MSSQSRVSSRSEEEFYHSCDESGSALVPIVTQSPFTFSSSSFVLFSLLPHPPRRLRRAAHAEILAWKLSWTLRRNFGVNIPSQYRRNSRPSSSRPVSHRSHHEEAGLPDTSSAAAAVRSPGWLLSPMPGVDHTHQLDGAGEEHLMSADLFGGSSSSSAHFDMRVPATQAFEGARHEGERQIDEGGPATRPEGGFDAAGVGSLHGSGSTRSDSAPRTGAAWAMQPRPHALLPRDDSAKSHESFASAHAGVAGSGDEASGWSDGGDRHRPLPLRDPAEAQSYRRADVQGGRQVLTAYAAHNHTQDDHSVCSSRSIDSSASGSGSTVSSQSSRSSSVISSSSGSGWGRGLWRRGASSRGAADTGNSTVEALEWLRHLTIHGKGGGERKVGEGEGGGGGAGAEPELHNGAVWVIRTSPDARLAATAGQCGLICVWQVATESGTVAGASGLAPPPLATFRGHKGPVPFVFISIHAWSCSWVLVALVFVRGHKGPVRFSPPVPPTFSVETPTPHPTLISITLSLTYSLPPAQVLDLAWSRDLLLLSASVDLTVRLW